MTSYGKLLFVVAAFGCNLSAAISVAAPETAPATASWNVPHDFASFSWPAHWFSDFAGNATHPNLFSRDILDLLKSKTGTAPFIRVGGTSTDRVWYNASQIEASINRYAGGGLAEYGIPDRVDVGPAWYTGFDNFPGSKWSFQINMGQTWRKPGGLDNAMESAQLVLDRVQGNLEYFQVGNEPNLMPWFEHRPEDYNMSAYVRDWNEYAAAAVERILKNNTYGLEKKRFFQGLTAAGMKDPKWGIEAAIAEGLDKYGFLKSVTYHQYSASNQGWVRLQNSYMNHTANAANVTQYKPAIEFCHKYEPFLPVVLGETNSNSYNLNMEQIEGVFGSALWLIDHLLMGMANNITRYNLIQGTTFGYTGWVPVARDGLPPRVKPPLYGQIFAADVLGLHPEVKIQSIEGLPWNMSAYGVYESNSLAKYVVVNYDEWNTTTAHPRPSLNVTLDVPAWVGGAQISRLTGPGASSYEGISWAGQSWNHTDGRLAMTGRKTQQLVQAVNGKLSVDLPSTEAILVTLKAKGTACGLW